MSNFLSSWRRGSLGAPAQERSADDRVRIPVPRGMDVRAHGHHCSDRLPDPRLRSRIGITLTQNHPGWISPAHEPSRSTGRLPLTGAEWVLVAAFAVASF